MSDKPIPDPALVDPIVEAIRPILAGQRPELIGGALGDLVATFIASHAPPLRDFALDQFVGLVRNLVPICVEEMIARGRAPPEWRGEPDDEPPVRQ